MFSSQTFCPIEANSPQTTCARVRIASLEARLRARTGQEGGILLA